MDSIYVATDDLLLSFYNTNGRLTASSYAKSKLLSLKFDLDEFQNIKKMPGTCQMILDLDVNPLQALLRGARERASVSFGRRVT